MKNKTNRLWKEIEYKAIENRIDLKELREILENHKAL